MPTSVTVFKPARQILLLRTLRKYQGSLTVVADVENLCQKGTRIVYQFLTDFVQAIRRLVSAYQIVSGFSLT